MKTLVSWSSGKDSAWTLHTLRQGGQHEVVGLVTTVNSTFGRVAMHGTRIEVARAQAAAAALPLFEVPLPWPCTNDVYEQAMRSFCDQAAAMGVKAIAFGDLFLEDVRRYREQLLAGTSLIPLFPLWGEETAALLRTMLRAGVRAHIVCLDPARMPRSLAGCVLDEELMRALPPDVDPCAEKGEFHTCVSAGPFFCRELPVVDGDVVDRSGMVFSDLMLAPTP